MSKQERKSILDLPVNIILTESGTSFFIQNKKPLKKIQLADAVAEYGLTLDRFTPVSLQRMLLIDYISSLKITKSEFMDSRHEIMDFSKLVVYSLLYRRFDARTFECLLSSELVRGWNRQNPGNTIDKGIHVDTRYLQGVLKEEEKDILQIKKQILSPFYESINRNPELLPDEKNIQLLLSEKFLTTLRPLVWFLISRFRGSKGFDTFLEQIRQCLGEYMEKSRIADYLSHLIVELTVYTENSNLKHEAENLFKGSVDMNAVLFEPNIRRKVIDSLTRKGELVSISWKMNPQTPEDGSKAGLSIAIFNRESGFDRFQDLKADAEGAGLVRKSLQEFYKAPSGGDSNMELGLYYLSYLSEVCETANIWFKADAACSESQDLNLVTLDLIV